MAEWIKAYQSQCTGATIDYQAVGSGAGIQAFITADRRFAGSDSALKADEQPQRRRQAAPAARRINLPMVGGADRRRLQPRRRRQAAASAPTLAGIFAGKITKWNDPAIAAATRARRCRTPSIAHVAPLGRLGHDRQLHQVPHRPRRGPGPSARARPGRPRAARAPRARTASPARSRAPRLHRLRRVVVRREPTACTRPRSTTARASQRPDAESAGKTDRRRQDRPAPATT